MTSSDEHKNLDRSSGKVPFGLEENVQCQPKKLKKPMFGFFIETEILA